MNAPELRINVINLVNLMKLQPQNEHAHRVSDTDFDELFTKDKLIEHEQYMDKNGRDLPEIRNWKCGDFK